MSLAGRLRRMRSELGYLHRADGSSSYSQGRTSVWASCCGPGDIHIARREDEQMHLDVSYRQLTGDCQYHWLINVIRTTLESVLDPKVFPRTGFTVTTQLLQSDGSEGAAALTSVCLAMLDNGISIRSPFCGVEVCEVDGKLVLDADAKTEAKAEAKWLFIFTRTIEGNAEMIASDSVGPFDMTKFASAASLAGEVL
ncbi:hypothetical protein RB195_018627 [Necator americanus]|uniref:Exoribonuclease phosphorolytic domain-containing protein n=1 Tax=Necator americanus TaxID=51031 RepID=A0ABR1CDL2_NECAM